VSDTDYVIRSWSVTKAGHAQATVVDMHGRIAHVVVRDAYAPHGDIDGLIRQRLTKLRPWSPPPT
jgi:hypothetical protein